MKNLFAGLAGWLKSLQAALVSFGALGILGIAFLDAALIPLPGGPDVVLISLSHHSHAMMPLYVVAAVVGSTLGSFVLYLIARKGGDAALRKFSAERRARVQRLLEKYDVWALLVAAVFPPPFPFKLFILSAGAFHMPVWRFFFALIVGRGFRFILEGLAAVYYGEQAMDMFKQHYPKIGFGIVAAIVVIFLLNMLLRRRRQAIAQE
jgi:membrane protein YqaA with SNARE-associated domain